MVAGVDVQASQEGADTDSADDLAAGQACDDVRDLIADVRLDRSVIDVEKDDSLRFRSWKGMQESATQARQLLPMFGPLTFDARLVCLEGRGIRAPRGPSSEVADPIPHRGSRRSNRIVPAVELPEAVGPDDHGAAAPESRRLFAERTPLASRGHDSNDVGL
jgi:hypothetical protein